MLNKLLSNWANRLDPKFKVILASGEIEKYNSVMALKMRIKQLDEAKTKYKWVECW